MNRSGGRTLNMLIYVNYARTSKEQGKQLEILDLSSKEAIKYYPNSSVILLEIIETKIKCSFG